MTDSEQKRLDELRLNIERLIKRLDTQESEADRLRKENDELRIKIETLESDKDAVVRRYENLKVAKALSGDVSGNQSARQKINTIVREIDKCLALLNR